MTTLKEQLYAHIKEAMRARDKKKLDTLRLISAAIKQIEVDERIDVDDTRMLVILDKMVKQRHESISHYTTAQRADLIAQEEFELAIIQHYMPEPLSENAIIDLIAEAFATVKVQHISDMGKIMAYIKPLMQGRADMGRVSALVKTKLNEALG